MTKAKTMMRGILTRSEILDYLTKEDVEEKIEALLKKDAEQRTECMEEFENVVESPLPKEEKERLMLEIMKDRISGQGTIEKEQRMAALRVRKDYADFKKHENEAFDAIVSGNFRKYDRALMKAVDASDLVDMGLEYIENAAEFFSSFKVTKVSILSDEEAREMSAKKKILHLKDMNSLF